MAVIALEGVGAEEARMIRRITFHYDMAILTSATYTVGPPLFSELHLHESMFDVSEMYRYVQEKHALMGTILQNDEDEFKHESFFCRLLSDKHGYSRTVEDSIYTKLNGDWYEDRFQHNLGGAHELMGMNMEHFMAHYERIRKKYGIVSQAFLVSSSVKRGAACEDADESESGSESARMKKMRRTF
jgi:hypothetical protein